MEQDYTPPSETGPEIIELEKLDHTPRSHVCLWTACDILIILYAIAHIGLTFLLAWYTRSQTWALIFCFSSFAIFGILSIVPCCMMRNTRAKRFHMTVTAVLIFFSFIVVGLCGSLLGWGAAGYSQFYKVNVASGLTLADASSRQIINDKNYGAFYFTNQNSYVFSMAGRVRVCTGCADMNSCCTWFHVVPVVPGEDPAGYVASNATVPFWASTLSSQEDPFYAFGGTPNFANKATRAWQSVIYDTDIESALKDACSKTECGASRNSPVLVIDDIQQQKEHYNAFLIAGYVTTGVLVPILLVLLALSFCVKI